MQGSAPLQHISICRPEHIDILEITLDKVFSSYLFWTPSRSLFLQVPKRSIHLLFCLLLLPAVCLVFLRPFLMNHELVQLCFRKGIVMPQGMIGNRQI